MEYCLQVCLVTVLQFEQNSSRVRILQVSLVVKRELFTSVPGNGSQNSSHVLILQVSLVVKIEVEVSSCTEHCLQVCLVAVL